MSVLRTAWLIARKDVRQRLRDRSAIIFGVAAPLGLAFVLSAVFPDTTAALDLSIAVADEDGGAVAVPLSSGTVDRVAGQLGLDVRRVTDAASVRALVGSGDVDAGIAIPAGFTDAVRSAEPATVTILATDTGGIASQVARGIVDGYLAQIRATQLTVAALARLDAPIPPPDTLGAELQVSAPIRLEPIATGSRILDAPTALAAGMAAFFLFFTVQFGVTGLLEERQAGTLPRLFAGPVSRAGVIGGKVLTSALLGLGSMAVLVVATSVLLGASWGDPLAVAVLVAALVVAATGIVAVLAGVARNAEQAGVWQSIVAIVLGMLGGSFFPVGQTPGLLARLTYLTPHAWFLRGLAELQDGGGIGDVIPAVSAIVAFGGIGFLAAAVLARRRFAP